LLEEVFGAGLRDGTTCEALAELYRPQKDRRAAFYA